MVLAVVAPNFQPFCIKRVYVICSGLCRGVDISWLLQLDRRIQRGLQIRVGGSLENIFTH